METNFRQILILRGIPGSGKSTYARTLVNGGWSRVNKDELREMINNYVLDNVDELMIHDIQSHIIQQMMVRGKNIVIDNTHTKWSYVSEIFKLISRTRTTYEYGIIVKTIEVPIEEAIRRNALRERPVFVEVIERMSRQLEASPNHSWHSVNISPDNPLLSDS